MPKSAGDLVIKGEDDKGRLRYTWKDVEVLVTPLEKRELLPGNASKIARSRATESTAEQALRKMKEKVRRMIMKAARGECERIIAKNTTFISNQAPTEDQVGNQTVGAWPSHRSAALGKLDDPIVRTHLRDSFSYLNTIQLYYCKNCDEEWPVFTGEWPKAGAATAGPKCGYSETIERVGWKAARGYRELCSRCHSIPIQREMYSY